MADIEFGRHHDVPEDVRTGADYIRTAFCNGARPTARNFKILSKRYLNGCFMTTEQAEAFFEPMVRSGHFVLEKNGDYKLTDKTSQLYSFEHMVNFNGVFESSENSRRASAYRANRQHLGRERVRS